jgi:hypothetical protein
VQFSPGLADPVVSITDDHGNPIFVNGAVLQLVPSDTATALVQSRYGTLSPQHVWRGFTTNVLLDYPDGASTATYIVTYTFPAPVEARGAVWTSDDADQRRGSIVVDGFNVLGPCTADFNHDNIVNSQDFFDFVTAFFAFAPAADFNGDGVINSQDFFDFVTAFFAGCP